MDINEQTDGLLSLMYVAIAYTYKILDLGSLKSIIITYKKEYRMASNIVHL